MNRRRFLGQAGLVGTAAAVAGCAPADCPQDSGATGQDVRLEWKMVTAWPRNFPGLGTAANEVAKGITRMSGGRLTVKVYGAGDLVPAFEVFDAVSSGTAEMGHASPYYWKGKVPAGQFFASVPFGLTSIEMNAWLYFGGGLDLWRRLYEPFNLVPFPAGNSGAQMGGWFNKPINSVADLQGLRMRIPGLGGEVLERAGGVPVSLPGAEIFTSLQSGAIDATEWVGPYNDLAFGLPRAARYYYHPGWHEPGTALETMIHKPAFEALPDDLKAIVEAACHRANDLCIAEYTARNAEALEAVRQQDVEIRRFPDDVLQRLSELSETVVAEAGGNDSLAQEIHQSYRAFRLRSREWIAIGEADIYQARGITGG